MRVILDLQGAQNGSRFRGIGRYSLCLAKALVESRGSHEVLIALSDRFPETISAIQSEFADILPRENIRICALPEGVAFESVENTPRRQAAEFIREAFLLSLKPDIVHISSLVEGFNDETVTSIGRFTSTIPTAVTLYDLIPLLYRKEYLASALFEEYYENKMDHLRRADLYLAISESSRSEGIWAGLPANKVVTISSAADASFTPLSPSQEERADFLKRYNLREPFVLYSGGSDPRKNIKALIRAFSLLPENLRSTYQLVIACKIHDHELPKFKELIQSSGLGPDQIRITGFVPDPDLHLFYSLCSLFVFPSLHEGFGLPVLEAMSCGAPVITSENSSLPEVIGLKEALVDPHNDEAICHKILEVLTNENMRRNLADHGLQRAALFSWENVAQKTWQAFEMLHAAKKDALTAPHPVTWRRPNLAFVTSWPPEQNEAAQYAAALLPELSRYYSIHLVVAQENVTHPWSHANGNVYPSDWLLNHAPEMDRVVYLCDASPVSGFWASLMEEVPGILILHDFFWRLAPHAHAPSQAWIDWKREVYYSHGYVALQECHKPDTQMTYPANLSTLQIAIGIIAHSEWIRKQGATWYGDTFVSDWRILPCQQAEQCLRVAEGQRTMDDGDTFSRSAEQYYTIIEELYSEQHGSTVDLINCMAKEIPMLDEESRIHVAQNLARNFPLRQPKRQLFVDISELVQCDSKSGIQRVTRSVLKELLINPPEGYRVEPVWASIKGAGYHYAQEFTCDFLGIPSDWATDVCIEPHAGDIFLGLDLQLLTIPKEADTLHQLAAQGVIVRFVVYDLLPETYPEYFPEHIIAPHQNWVSAVSQFDGVVCISQAVANEMHQWMQLHTPERVGKCQVDWFHLGADLEQSMPTTGMPADADKVLSTLKQRPTMLMVSTLEPRKGYAQALEAAEALWQRGADMNLVIVGKKGWRVEELATHLEKHPEKGKRLFWLAGISDEYLECLYMEATVLLMASFGEGFGLALIEAARYKKPLIIRDIPVFREVAREYAFYFDGTSGEALADAIEEWLHLYASGAHPISEGIPVLTWKQSTDMLLDRLGLHRKAVS